MLARFSEPKLRKRLASRPRAVMGLSPHVKSAAIIGRKRRGVFQSPCLARNIFNRFPDFFQIVKVDFVDVDLAASWAFALLGLDLGYVIQDETV